MQMFARRGQTRALRAESSFGLSNFRADLSDCHLSGPLFPFGPESRLYAEATALCRAAPVLNLSGESSRLRLP